MATITSHADLAQKLGVSDVLSVNQFEVDRVQTTLSRLELWPRCLVIERVRVQARTRYQLGHLTAALDEAGVSYRSFGRPA